MGRRCGRRSLSEPVPLPAWVVGNLQNWKGVPVWDEGYLGAGSGPCDGLR